MIAAENFHEKMYISFCDISLEASRREDEGYAEEIHDFILFLLVFRNKIQDNCGARKCIFIGVRRRWPN